MNNVLKLVERQYGLSNNRTYDSILHRLCAHTKDNWKGITPSINMADYNPEPPIFSAKFCNVENNKNILALANEDGKIALQNTDISQTTVEETSLAGQQCHYNAVFDLEWMPGNMKFVSASGDHTARLWEITESDFTMTKVFNGHTRSVKTAAFRKTDPSVFATGGRDGAILIWDTRVNHNVNLMPKADNCIYSGHSGGPGTPQSYKTAKSRHTPKLPPNISSSSITGLGFQNDLTLVSCGAGDGIIKVWDLRRNYTCFKKEPLPKYSLGYAGSSTFKGFTNLLIDNSGLRLYVNCMDSTIYCYNLSSYSQTPIQRYKGLKNTTFYIKSCLSPDGQYLVSGSSDEKAYIWNVNYEQPVVALAGHTVEVTCVAWSQSSDIRLVTCSDDARHKIWKIGPEFIGDDEKINYKGKTEVIKEYQNNLTRNNKFKTLDHTPRSVKRLIDRNENTPTSVEKSHKKRSFAEICDEDDDRNFGHRDTKRTNTETKGRRLFSPTTSSTTVLNRTPNSLTEDEPQSKQQRLLSPLMERVEKNMQSPPSQEITTRSSAVRSLNQIFSPTSNLPNYVIDGEAPHLRIQSPKRKLKENVDWLTKIRKQKLLSTPHLKLFVTNNQSSDTEDNNDINSYTNETASVMSPRVQSLKSSEYSPSTSNGGNSTARRRTSRSGSTSDSNHPRTPNSSRRHSTETSILKFFTLTQSTK